MSCSRPHCDPVRLLQNAGLRPTRQRLAIARLLFGDADRHVTAESLHRDVRASGAKISLATIYNSLHQFAAAGLLREVVAEPGRSYFDTNTSDHHHFFYPDTGRLVDIDGSAIRVEGLPVPPEGARIDRVDIIVRVDESA